MVLFSYFLILLILKIQDSLLNETFNAFLSDKSLKLLIINNKIILILNFYSGHIYIYIFLGAFGFLSFN